MKRRDFIAVAGHRHDRCPRTAQRRRDEGHPARIDEAEQACAFCAGSYTVSALNAVR
jgi:hypothetical protein